LLDIDETKGGIEQKLDFVSISDPRRGPEVRRHPHALSQGGDPRPSTVNS
jgi:hypothetical protein